MMTIKAHPVFDNPTLTAKSGNETLLSFFPIPKF